MQRRTSVVVRRRAERSSAACLLAPKKAAETSSRFVRCGITGKNGQFFEIGGFTDGFPTYPSCGDGLAALR